MEGKTARGASSPANPALHMPEIRKNIIYFKKPHYRSSGQCMHRRRMFRSTVPAKSPLHFFIFSGGYSSCRNGNRILKEDDASLLSLELAPSPLPLVSYFLSPFLSLSFFLSVWQVESLCNSFVYLVS
jgi:hypothetical protein